VARTGRPAKATEQHLREGTLRGVHSQTPLLNGGRDRPKPSTHLSKSVKKHFKRFVKELWDGGVLDKSDRAMIELAAIEASLIDECNSDIELRGMNVEVVRGGYNGSDERTLYEPNPSVTMRAHAMTHLRQLLGELGIGPASRARLANSGVKRPGAKKFIPGMDEVGKKREALRRAAGE